MSAKQLRKLRDLREAEATAAALSPVGGEATADHAGVYEHGAHDGSGGEPEGAHEEIEAASDGEVIPEERVHRFALLAGDSDDASSSSSSCPSTSWQRCANEEEPPASAPLPAKRKRRARKAAGREASDDEICLQEGLESVTAEGDIDIPGYAVNSNAPEAGVLCMRRLDFSVESERRRVTGRSGLASLAGVPGATMGDGAGGAQRRRLAVQSRSGGEGRIAHHRRLYLVIPTAEEPWPRPDDNAAMHAVAGDNGAELFGVEETKKSKKGLDRLHECLRSEDPQAVQQLLEQQPFCIDALVVLAEYFRGQRQLEQAFKLTRRAVYAVECAFAPGFSPFQESAGGGPGALRPRTALSLPRELMWPGWSWLAALWMYMQGLASQGMHRTALEVCKLLLAMTLPRDPTLALLSCDFLCLRSKQYDTLSRLNVHLVPQYGLDAMGGGIVTRLDLILPNFAFSIPLASMLKVGAPPSLSALGQVAVSDVISVLPGIISESELEEDSAPAFHVQLLRALLLFPLALRPLLDEMGLSTLHGPAPGGSTSRETWAELLSRPPFSDASDLRHREHAAAHARICSAYAKRCGAVWKSDGAVRWLHACAARLCKMHESSVFADDLTSARKSWQESSLCLNEALKKDYVEVLPEHGSLEETATPQFLKRAAQARLQPKRRIFFHGPHGQEDDAQPTISLHSPTLLIFFQALLPWGELDRSGVVLEPYVWLDVGRDAAGVARFVAVFLAGAACDVVRLLGPAAGWLWETGKAMLRIPDTAPGAGRARERKPRGRRR